MEWRDGKMEVVGVMLKSSPPDGVSGGWRWVVVMGGGRK